MGPITDVDASNWAHAVDIHVSGRLRQDAPTKCVAGLDDAQRSDVFYARS
jgi:hypothetical protein